MTDAQMLKTFHDRMGRIETGMDRIGQQVGEMQGVVKANAAILEAHLERTRTEVEVLFRDRKDHERRLGQIEKTYVQEDDCQRLHGDHEKRLNDAWRCLTGVKVRLAGILGAAVVLSSIVTLTANALMRGLGK